MAKRIKGKCKYCGKEYTISYMNKHLPSCEKRREKLAGETKGRQCGYFELAIYPKYHREHWLFIEIRDTATLKDLDSFLRDIWLECCGHLSAFEIGGIRYESMPVNDPFWGEPVKSMNCRLKTVLEKGMTINYEYDFGSTTELMITVVNNRTGRLGKEKLTILSRNNPHVYMCDECGKKPAVCICAECIYEGYGLLCEDCAKDHECGEEMLMDLCNSPRMGVCAYEGSEIYPDQFMADPELEKDKGV